MSAPYPIRYRIRDADDGEPARVDIFDDIGDYGWFGGLSAQEFAASMANIKGDVHCHLNSGGGDVYDGRTIARSLLDHKGKVTVIVDGIAASIASVILQAGQERVVQPGSMVMIHEAFGGCVGPAADMAKAAETLDKVSGDIAKTYAKRAGGTPDEWRAAMRKETWYTAEEAVAAGLADRVGADPAALPAQLDLAAYQFPGRIAARLRILPANWHPGVGPQDAPGTHPSEAAHAHSHPAPAPADAEQSCESLGHQCCKDAAAEASAAKDALQALQDKVAADGKDMHGDHERWDPDGDGDCDACPEGDTDNDYWSPDGQQLLPIPGKPMPAEDRALTADDIRAIVREEYAALRNADGEFDESAWDAAKAWHAGAESDDPAAFYAGICAGKKAGDKATQDAWALPYKYSPSSKPNAAGVKAALGRLSQTEGLTNADEAKSLLQGLMKKINPDYEPDDSASGTPADLTGTEFTDDDFEQFRTALRGAAA